MDVQILILLGTILTALVLFSLERIPTDATALGVMLFLVITGLLPAEQAFAGFGSDVFVLILGLLILMEALSRTGVTGYVGSIILQRTSSGPRHILLTVMISAVAIGAFMSNTAATAFFLPIVIGLAGNAKLSPAKFLMPLAFASILASSITLIGTSTNIVVSGLMAQYGLAPISMFELAPAGIPIALAGLAYMFLLGHRLVPDRIPAEELEGISKGLYLTEILVPLGSSLVGKTLGASGLGRDLDLTVLRIIRGRRHIVPRADTMLVKGDVLLVEGARENILRVKQMNGVEIKADVDFSLSDLETEDVMLADVIITPSSSLIRRTLRGLDFRNRYELQVLAVNRHGRTLTRQLSRVRLQTADILVVQGASSRIEALERQGHFRILRSTGEKRPNRRRMWIAISIFAGTLAAATFNLLSLPVAMLLGALLVFATRCITPEEAYRQINWKVLILIASMLALGAAMETTGTADFLAAQIVALLGSAQPVWLLTGFFALTVLLTQPMSNQAAAAVVLPVAIQTARQIGLNPRSFAIMIALAASCSFLTPLEPACLLVYGPGRYRFVDFIKVGAPLTVLVYAIAIVMVMVIWPVYM
ncbi:MAG: SLC13 family permease [Anaerolineae bacterium]|nr:SLC13 family permease [Anaerolineae bacterium]